MADISKTHYWEKKVLDLLSGTSISPPAHTYLALYTISPDDNSTGTEVSGGSYARVEVTWDAAVDNGASEGSYKLSNNDVIFATASADWGTIVAAALLDNSSGGNMLYWAGFTMSFTYLNGDQRHFPVGFITVREH